MNTNHQDRTGQRDINQKILASCGYRALQDDPIWIDGFRSTLKKAKDHSESASQIAKLTNASMEMVEHALDCLTHYAVKFNQISPDIRITVSNPTLVTEYSNSLKVGLRGRLSSKDWTLIVRSNGILLDFLIIPICKVLSFSSFSETLKPIFSIEPQELNESIVWVHEGRIYSQTELTKTVFQKAFKMFIEQVYAELRKECSEFEIDTELFECEMTQENLEMSNIESRSCSMTERESDSEFPSTVEFTEYRFIEDEGDEQRRIDFESELHACRKNVEQERVCEPEERKIQEERFVQSSIEEAQAREFEVENETPKGIHTFVSDCIDDLINEKKGILNRVVACGSLAFERNEFERVEIQLKEATLKKQQLTSVLTLSKSWNEIDSIDVLIEKARDKEIRISNFDTNDDYITPEERLRSALDHVYTTLQKIGTSAFSRLDLELVELAYKKLVEIKKIQAIFAGLYFADNLTAVNRNAA